MLSDETTKSSKTRHKHVSTGKEKAVLEDPTKPGWAIGSTTGPDDEVFPEWPVYKLSHTRSTYGLVSVARTRVGSSSFTQATPVRGGIDEANSAVVKDLARNVNKHASTGKENTMAYDFEDLESENAKQLARMLDRHMDEERECYGGSASPEVIAEWLDAHGVTAPGVNDD